MGLLLFYVWSRVGSIEEIASGSIISIILLGAVVAGICGVLWGTLPADLRRMRRQLILIDDALGKGVATEFRARPDRAIEVLRADGIWILDCGDQTLALCGSDLLPEDDHAAWPTSILIITAIPEIGILLNINSSGEELPLNEIRPRELPCELREELASFESEIGVGIKTLRTIVPEGLWG